MAFCYIVTTGIVGGEELSFSTYANEEDALSEYKETDPCTIQEIEGGKNIYVTLEHVEMLDNEGNPCDIDSWEYQGVNHLMFEKRANEGSIIDDVLSSD